ncbi:MAG: capsule biosynthesis protein, partial [Pedobacter sp.]|nr:capsule biosynthesis protein [Pedobacter sp.]
MKLKKALTGFLFFIFLLSTQVAFSQTNYADVKVDELSDAKIREMMQRAESVGYNDAQLEQMAAAQGMKPEEITKLRARVAKIRSGSGTINSKDTEVQSNGRTSAARNIQRDSTIKVDVLGDLRPKIFGSELFSKGNLSFEPNLRMATPRGYIIGPDDQLLIDLSGDNDVNYDLKVSP